MTRSWHDTTKPPAERADALLAEMTLEEKIAQLTSVWVGAEIDAAAVAPIDEAASAPATPEEATRDGIGHFPRPLGTAPVEPVEGARQLARRQRDLVERTRL